MWKIIFDQTIFYLLFCKSYIFSSLYIQLKKFIQLRMQNPNKDPNVKDYYSKADFWDQRYQAGGYFDWYAEFPQLQYAFETQYGMTKEDSILMVGCGNSKVSQQMFEAGYKNIVNIDISPTVIQQMKILSPDMEWLVMDATQMTFEDSKFDYVIDKGTMDALIAGRDLQPAVKLLRQCMRVTKQEGQLIQITYGSPQGRKKVFESSLPFNKFDYYFAYVNLNDMSTMINLMRNNLIGQDGQKIEKQVALQKSMKEFMMIKLLRAKRSKQKQFVIWENYSKNVQHVVPQKSSENSKEEVAQKALGQQEKKQEQTKPQESPKLQASQEIQKQNIKYQSKPQKQSYVYAYCIKRKFGYDFNPSEFSLVQIENQNELVSKELIQFQIKGSNNVKQSIDKCNQYCVKKQISHGKVNFVEVSSQFSNETQAVKLNIKEGKSVRINILSKSNITLKVNFSDLNILTNSLKKLSNYLMDKLGISFHPCPKTYSLFTVMRGRMKAKTVNELLSKYWYPTYIFENVDIQNGSASVIVSIPPVLPQILSQTEQLIKGFFASEKQIQVVLESSRNGFVTFPELNLLSTLNMASLSHNSGKSLQVYMQDFWVDSSQHFPQQNSKLFIVENTHIEVPNNIVAQVILHFMALY